MHQFCDIPEVIDVSAADRFGEQVVAVTIPTVDEHDAVSSMISDYDPNVSVHISPLFGIGSLTKESKETKKFESLIYKYPYNVYGTPEHKKLEELMKRVQARDKEVWASMDKKSRHAEIEKAIKVRRTYFRSDFGNCWSKQVER